VNAFRHRRHRGATEVGSPVTSKFGSGEMSMFVAIDNIIVVILVAKYTRYIIYYYVYRLNYNGLNYNTDNSLLFPEVHAYPQLT